MEVHPFAARGFSGVADEYERGRPEYPQAAIDWLARRIGLRPGATVVDVGAGTGKLARAILRLGAQVVAVEPLDAMREVLERAVPDADARPGSAEALPVADGSADAITAGQAAHWFRPDEAAAEFARVLRPAGGVGLIWNVRDLDDPLQAAIDGLIARERNDAARAGWARWREGLARAPFTPLEHATFQHAHELRADDVPALVSSFSYVGGLPTGKREEVLRRARELVAASDNISRGPEGERVRLAYRTEAYACRRL